MEVWHNIICKVISYLGNGLFYSVLQKFLTLDIHTDRYTNVLSNTTSQVYNKSKYASGSTPGCDKRRKTIRQRGSGKITINK